MVTFSPLTPTDAGVLASVAGLALAMGAALKRQASTPDPGPSRPRMASLMSWVVAGVLACASVLVLVVTHVHLQVATASGVPDGAAAPSVPAPAAQPSSGDVRSPSVTAVVGQVAETAVPQGARSGDRPWPSMDGLCGQLGFPSHAWLPGQTEVWVPGTNDAAALVPRKVQAKGAAYTWSCSKGGPPLNLTELTSNCTSYYGRSGSGLRYEAAVVDPDNAYTWICRSIA